MTSRPTAGIQRQPHRTLSGTGIAQRPVYQRSLSQQYSTAAPIRKPENISDLPLNGAENERHGASRLGGSRLKVELSKGSMDAPVLVDPLKSVSAAPNQEAIRGRPRFQFEAEPPHFRVSHGSTHLSSIRGVDNVTTTNPVPMPRRPAQSAPPSARGGRCPIAVIAKKEIRPKPYTLEVPSAAPHFQPSGHADFFPWTRDHPEDLFNDHVIRQGFFDKSQTTQNETGSARLSIFPAVKHKSGLHTLSSLFTAVLSQRRTHSQITSAPTFKPPPRVTLTDTKKETWLRDLANPGVPLRRLSRTIPHGIRGKVLLEQCLSKQVPTERAVWLAKCVGANEIRAFKRKGVTGAFAMGGEAKWIRDWTVSVEQFIESIVASCGDNDWKTRSVYAIRLGAHLYSEHLLDREHYMDWLSLSLESSSLAKAPIWLLITQLYWADLLSFRKSGRRVVAAMCSHLYSARESPDQDILLPLTERITSLLRGLVETHGESFISPKLWAKYNSFLAGYLFPNHEIPSNRYRSISRRNTRLSATQAKQILTPHRLLIGLLDKSLFRPYADELPQECRQIVNDLPALARTVLEWCTSPHRPGAAKIYIAARLLRVWGRSEIEVNEAVLDFLGARAYKPSMCKPSFYHLISELARSGHFSISKYIQWLVARGGLRGPADLAEDGPCATRLLAELPIHEIPESVARLRQTLLIRASTSMNDELQEVRIQIGNLEKLLSQAANIPEHVSEDENFLRSQEFVVQRSALSRAIKSEIGVWLRKRVSLCMLPLSTAPQSDWGEEKPNDIELAISPIEFNLIREILEDIEDFSMLADVLKMVTQSNDLQVLASAADTLCLHIEVFAAIGALNDLFRILLTCLRSLPEDSDTTAFQTSLYCLAGRFPGAELVALQLSQKLLRSNQRTAADACSPVSDHMTEVLDHSESRFSDEIEKIMASGTSMDLATLKRLFCMITSRMEASWYNDASQLLNCAVLLSRLRCFGVKHFEILMAAWLKTMLQTSKRPSLVSILGHLISVDCLDFGEVIISTASLLDGNLGEINPSTASKVAVEILTLLLGTSHELEALTISYRYHLSIRRLLMQSNHPNEVLSVIRRAIELSGSLAEYDHDILSSLCRSNRMCRLLRQIVLKDLDIVIRDLVTPLTKSLSPMEMTQFGQLIKRLLEPGVNEDTLEHTMAERIEHTLHLADDLTLPFCHLELQFILCAEITELSMDENDTPEHLKAFERAVDMAVANDNNSWTSIVPSLDVQIARHLCQRAERLLLQLVPTVRVEDYSIAVSAENENLAKRLLLVVDATSYSMQTNRTSYVASQIVERLNDIWQILSQGDPLVKTSVIDVWLPLLLDFITLHIEMFDNSKTSSELRSRILLTLTALLLELQSLPQTPPILLEQIFDVSILLVDDLSEDARQNCVKSLKDKTSDPRVCYIFGYSRPSMDWMQLSQKGKLMPYPLRRWEILSEPTPNVGENDTSLSLTLFGGRKQ